ncbi:DNA topoisomerase I [Methanospirillum stamsii]|uniref:DNA topoisomerase 1 n=1 Tax=Methanospirillum stamsii TaxID=1277351 RepID=A0A2V2MUG0_9EURY|nr:DNA topoisomerase I [Methanospirillum stamsii]PWR71824.1 DNA topoisomerase I [Methanospirillum stamsii]
MHLIIAEKNIAANRIAQILSGKDKVSAKKESGVNVYTFGEKTSVGLRGHVVEVDFVEGYTNWRSEERPPRSLIDAGTIKRPTEPAIVKLIQKIAKKANRITIATDFDTEGELIGKEAYELVRAVNPKVPVDRARFSAITREEINRAFSEPAEIDFDLAAAGEARQVVDLIWGASLTRFISLAAKRGGGNILSVGRVQSPTLAMIVDREREIESFIPEPYWEISLTSEKDGEIIEARHAEGRFTDKTLADAAYAGTKDPLLVTEVKEGKRVDRAPTPFDTTGFIVAAARIGYSAANAMRVAEELYMNGFISYPRTDNTIYPPSLNLDNILSTLEKTRFAPDVEWVKKNRRKKPTEGKKSSTDHPPIHPTGVATPEQLGENWKLYELVVRRFLATLSPDAEWATMRINMDASGQGYIATGSRLIDAGWRTVYPYSEAKDTFLPVVKKGERLKIQDLNLEEKQTQPPPRYSQSKLIQVMEELGLGTKSTRHEVIQKLISRKYIEGNPLRPTLVGKAVTDSLEAHASTITRPDMTQKLEQSMEAIKVRHQSRDVVVDDSRKMLHQVFNELEPNQAVIGQEIMGQTDEELTLGPCPVCGKDLRIRRKGGSQFIGCNGYPDCTFNISLPGTMWGSAIRTKKVCDIHNLYHVSLIAKGARPWEMGCPLCQLIEQQKEHYAKMPSMTEALQKKFLDGKIFSLYDLTRTDPAVLVKRTGVTGKQADTLIREANDVLDFIRKRSECKKFMKQFVPPKRGRSHSKVMNGFAECGINSIGDIVTSSHDLLKKSGLSDEEAKTLKNEAGLLIAKQQLKDMGIPAISLKKYHEAGFITPEQIFASHPAILSHKCGISIDTVNKHLTLIASALNKPAPEKISKKQFESGREELLSIPDISETALLKLYQAGIIDKKSLRTANPVGVIKNSGLSKDMVYKIREAAQG